MKTEFRNADIFQAEIPRGRFRLVYADPPYAGCRSLYARGNNSRQWGIHARADFLRDLIQIMESARHPDGVCAISMAAPELRLLHLFPTKHRVMAWTKPQNEVGIRPKVWPTFAWEPVVVWGCLPRNHVKGKRTPVDWLMSSTRCPEKKIHESAKPSAFAEWILEACLGDRGGPVLELFAGTMPVCRAAEARGLETMAYDLKTFDSI